MFFSLEQNCFLLAEVGVIKIEAIRPNKAINPNKATSPSMGVSLTMVLWGHIVSLDDPCRQRTGEKSRRFRCPMTTLNFVVRFRLKKAVRHFFNLS